MTPSEAINLQVAMRQLFNYELLDENERPRVRLTHLGVGRVLRGRVDQEFVVDRFTPGAAGWVAHVRDRRFEFSGDAGAPQLWSLARDCYEPVDNPTKESRAVEIIAQRAEAAGEHTFAAECRDGAWDHENRADIKTVLWQLNGGKF